MSPLLPGNKCFVPMSPENTVYVHALRSFHQNSKIEPFFFLRSSVIAVSIVHPSDYCSFAINEKYLVMKAETELETFLDKNRGEKPEKDPGAFNPFDQPTGKVFCTESIEKQIYPDSPFSGSDQCVDHSQASLILINNVGLEMYISFGLIYQPDILGKKLLTAPQQFQ
jgi:hypothetical protein